VTFCLVAELVLDVDTSGFKVAVMLYIRDTQRVVRCVAVYVRSKT
jgi:hypothetical protein